MSGWNVVVRAVSAVATVHVSGRPHPVPSSAPPHPCSSSSRACVVSVSRLLWPATASSPRWPGRTWFGMYHRNSRLMSIEHIALVGIVRARRLPMSLADRYADPAAPAGVLNEVLTLQLARRSVRSFGDRPVTEEELT